MPGSSHTASPILIWRRISKIVKRSSKRIESIQFDQFKTRFTKSWQSKISAKFTKSLLQYRRRRTERSFHKLLWSKGKSQVYCTFCLIADFKLQDREEKNKAHNLIFLLLSLDALFYIKYEKGDDKDWTWQWSSRPDQMPPKYTSFLILLDVIQSMKQFNLN